MSLPGRFLDTRVARRILVLFLVAALLPLAAVGYLANREAQQQLREQQGSFLRQATRSVGMATVQRLDLLADALARDAAALRRDAAVSLPAGEFDALWLARGAEVRRRVVGEPGDPPALDDAARTHLSEGGTALVARAGRAETGEFFLARTLDPDRPERGVLWARAPLASLWRVDAGPGAGPGEDAGVTGLPRDTELCVFRVGGEPLHCSEGRPPEPLLGAAAGLPAGGRQQFEWEGPEGPYLAGAWTAFLEPGFAAPSWQFVLSRPRDAVMGPVAGFRRQLLLVLLLTLLVVALASEVQIRRILVPLRELREATGRVAEGDYDDPAEVDSGDEFEELAESFNDMAARIRRQIRTLATVSEVDRSILSALETSEIVETVIRRSREILPGADVRVLALDRAGEPEGSVYRVEPDDGPPAGVGLEEEPVELDVRTLERLRAGSGGFEVEAGALGGRLGDGDGGARRWTLFPVLLQGEPAGALALARSADAPPPGEDARRTGQHLADQLAVALSNAGLLEELDELTWGALRSLARAIDAKSPWTAGHSDRVAALAVEIAGEMGLPEEERARLQRGGLLHDIGKLGVPAEILDKPDDLEGEEWETMKKHTEIGVRILEPVSRYRDILPLVRHHHERWDGGGYPAGLEGEEIPRLARILAVADTVDAMLSDRPYRSARTVERTLAVVREEAGRQLDPEPARTLVELAEAGEVDLRAMMDRSGDEVWDEHGRTAAAGPGRRG